MSKTEKHVRKSGATTVMKGGRIVANIGSGKTNVPTPSTATLPPASNDATDTHNVFSPNYDSIVTLWRLFPEDDPDAKVALLLAYTSQMVQEDITKTIGTINNYIGELPHIQRLRLMGAFSKTNLPDKLAMGIIKCGGPLVKSVITNVNTDQKIIDHFLDNYADHPDEWIAACYNPRLNSEALRKAYLALHNFSSDKNNSIGIRRCASGGLRNVAEHPNTTSDILDYLYDENKYVWMDAIVCNANASRHVLDDAMARNDSHLKAQIATNPQLPEDIAFTLYDTSTEDDTEIRYALAANPHTPNKILARLTLSKDSDVSAVATYNLEV